jgi:hypothetical protein
VSVLFYHPPGITGIWLWTNMSPAELRRVEESYHQYRLCQLREIVRQRLDEECDGA